MQTLASGSHQRLSPESVYVSPTSLSLQPLRIIALGDSLVYGFGDPEGGGWVERLRRQWMSPDASGHVLYNLGVRGDGVRQVAQRLEHEFRHRGELRHKVPDAIVLSVGVNDSARLGHAKGRNFTAFEDFQCDLSALLDQAQRLCSVFFVGMTPVDESRMPFANSLHYSHSDQYRYKEATRLACLERQIPYLDIWEQWLARDAQGWRSLISVDGLHPNSTGYKTLLQDFISWDAVHPWVQIPLATA
jgi:lysophospholipase L1-like esterase